MIAGTALRLRREKRAPRTQTGVSARIVKPSAIQDRIGASIAHARRSHVWHSAHLRHVEVTEPPIATTLGPWHQRYKALPVLVWGQGNRR